MAQFFKSVVWGSIRACPVKVKSCSISSFRGHIWVFRAANPQFHPTPSIRKPMGTDRSLLLPRIGIADDLEGDRKGLFIEIVSCRTGSLEKQAHSANFACGLELRGLGVRIPKSNLRQAQPLQRRRRRRSGKVSPGRISATVNGRKSSSSGAFDGRTGPSLICVGATLIIGGPSYSWSAFASEQDLHPRADSTAL